MDTISLQKTSTPNHRLRRLMGRSKRKPLGTAGGARVYFPFTNIGFLSYLVFLTHRHFPRFLLPAFQEGEAWWKTRQSLQKASETRRRKRWDAGVRSPQKGVLIFAKVSPVGGWVFRCKVCIFLKPKHGVLGGSLDEVLWVQKDFVSIWKGSNTHLISGPAAIFVGKATGVSHQALRCWWGCSIVPSRHDFFVFQSPNDVNRESGWRASFRCHLGKHQKKPKKPLQNPTWPDPKSERLEPGIMDKKINGIPEFLKSIHLKDYRRSFKSPHSKNDPTIKQKTTSDGAMFPATATPSAGHFWHCLSHELLYSDHRGSWERHHKFGGKGQDGRRGEQRERMV